MKRDELEPIVRNALNMLFARDAQLFTVDGSEWSLTHRLAVYLEGLLPGWNVDCEYNRQGETENPKKLAGGKPVRPDIIIHHRGQITIQHNLLVVEVKKSDSGPDFAKVCEYTAPPSDYREFQYMHGVAIDLSASSPMVWFENGSPII